MVFLSCVMEIEWNLQYLNGVIEFVEHVNYAVHNTFSIPSTQAAQMPRRKRKIRTCIANLRKKRKISDDQSTGQALKRNEENVRLLSNSRYNSVRNSSAEGASRCRISVTNEPNDTSAKYCSGRASRCPRGDDTPLHTSTRKECFDPLVWKR